MIASTYGMQVTASMIMAGAFIVIAYLMGLNFSIRSSHGVEEVDSSLVRETRHDKEVDSSPLPRCEVDSEVVSINMEKKACNPYVKELLTMDLPAMYVNKLIEKFGQPLGFGSYIRDFSAEPFTEDEAKNATAAAKWIQGREPKLYSPDFGHLLDEDTLSDWFANLAEDLFAKKKGANQPNPKFDAESVDSQKWLTPTDHSYDGEQGVCAEMLSLVAQPPGGSLFSMLGGNPDAEDAEGKNAEIFKCHWVVVLLAKRPNFVRPDSTGYLLPQMVKAFDTNNDHELSTDEANLLLRSAQFLEHRELFGDLRHGTAWYKATSYAELADNLFAKNPDGLAWLQDAAEEGKSAKLRAALVAMKDTNWGDFVSWLERILQPFRDAGPSLTLQWHDIAAIFDKQQSTLDEQKEALDKQQSVLDKQRMFVDSLRSI